MPALSDAYADVTTYKARLGITVSTFDAHITTDLTLVSRYLDKKLNRRHTGFSSDGSLVSRVFYPRGYYAGNPEAENPWMGVRGSRDLTVDDISTATGLVITIDTNRDGNFADETALAATGYQLLPLNADKYPEPEPFNVIQLPAWSTRQGWPAGCPVQVTAKFGWPAIPTGITRATLDLTSILRLESPEAVTRTEEDVIGVLSGNEKAIAIVANLPKTYKRDWVFA
jgi:hypothetical protein